MAFLNINLFSLVDTGSPISIIKGKIISQNFIDKRTKKKYQLE